MDVLIMLVIAMFIITAAYVGYHASQQQMDEKEIGGHSVPIELEILNENSESIQIFQKYGLIK